MVLADCPVISSRHCRISSGSRGKTTDRYQRRSGLAVEFTPSWPTWPPGWTRYLGSSGWRCYRLTQTEQCIFFTHCSPSRSACTPRLGGSLPALESCPTRASFPWWSCPCTPLGYVTPCASSRGRTMSVTWRESPPPYDKRHPASGWRRRQRVEITWPAKGSPFSPRMVPPTYLTPHATYQRSARCSSLSWPVKSLLSRRRSTGPKLLIPRIGRGITWRLYPWYSSRPRYWKETLSFQRSG